MQFKVCMLLEWNKKVETIQQQDINKHSILYIPQLFTLLIYETMHMKCFFSTFANAPYATSKTNKMQTKNNKDSPPLTDSQLNIIFSKGSIVY